MKRKRHRGKGGRFVKTAATRRRRRKARAPQAKAPRRRRRGIYVRKSAKYGGGMRRIAAPKKRRRRRARARAAVVAAPKRRRRRRARAAVPAAAPKRRRRRKARAKVAAAPKRRRRRRARAKVAAPKRRRRRRGHAKRRTTRRRKRARAAAPRRRRRRAVYVRRSHGGGFRRLRDSYPRSNPMGGGELLFAAVTGVAGMLAQQFLDAWLATAPGYATPPTSTLDNTAAVNSAPTLGRVAASAGLAVVPLVAAHLVGSPMVRAGLQGFGLGVVLGLGTQVVRHQIIGRFFGWTKNPNTGLMAGTAFGQRYMPNEVSADAVSGRAGWTPVTAPTGSALPAATVGSAGGPVAGPPQQQTQRALPQSRRFFQDVGPRAQKAGVAGCGDAMPVDPTTAMIGDSGSCAPCQTAGGADAVVANAADQSQLDAQQEQGSAAQTAPAGVGSAPASVGLMPAAWGYDAAAE